MTRLINLFVIEMTDRLAAVLFTPGKQQLESARAAAIGALPLPGGMRIIGSMSTKNSVPAGAHEYA